MLEILANGEFVRIDDTLLEKLRMGDAISGWTGDLSMELFYNPVDDHCYLSALDDNGESYIVWRSNAGERQLDDRLLHMLAAHDRNNGYDAGKEIAAHNEKLDEENDKAATEKWDAAAEKLAWGLKKDIRNGNI